MAAMAFESAETFSPSVRNRLSGATGLIQFMPSTAQRLGTTTDALAAMTPEKQLDYVSRYFSPYSGRLGTIEDVYMVILWPKAVGASNDTALFAKQAPRTNRTKPWTSMAMAWSANSKRRNSSVPNSPKA